MLRVVPQGDNPSEREPANSAILTAIAIASAGKIPCVKTLVPANNASARAVAKRIPPRSVIAAIGTAANSKNTRSSVTYGSSGSNLKATRAANANASGSPDDGYPKATHMAEPVHARACG